MKVIVLLFAIGLLGTEANAQVLEARFIGNAAVEITDGKTTLYSDFPYQSGAFGYMKYRFEDQQMRSESVCLITHDHADHFDPGLFTKAGCKLIGPEGLQKKVPADRTIPLADEVRFKDIVIKPVRTKHGDVEHYSYLVSWHGKRLYFTGDTDTTTDVASLEGIDVLFVTPWLLASLGEKLPEAKRIVIYHHRDDEKLPARNGVLAPKQGEKFSIGPDE